MKSVCRRFSLLAFDPTAMMSIPLCPFALLVSSVYSESWWLFHIGGLYHTEERVRLSTGTNPAKRARGTSGLQALNTNNSPFTTLTRAYASREAAVADFVLSESGANPKGGRMKRTREPEPIVCGLLRSSKEGRNRYFRTVRWRAYLIVMEMG